MNEYYLTDKGQKYWERLRDYSDYRGSLSSRGEDWVNLHIAKNFPETLEEHISLNPHLKESFRRLFEAGYIDKE